jgi:sugar phosphate isomerase/epimerase
MKRRDFVQQTALTSSLLLVHPPAMIKIKARHIGVQMWSVRDVADHDPKGTFEKLAGMGYAEVEGYRYENGMFYTYSPAAFAKLLKDVDLQMTSAHTGISLKHWDTSTHTLNDLAKKTIDDHAAIGVQQLICPYIDDEWRTTEYLKQLCELFNHVGEACKKSGIQFGYHNHDFEFKKLENKFIIDHILGQTDPTLVIWEMDLYWVKYANEDPAQWINQYGDRIHAFHVKDMANTSKRETIEVGEGNIDFESFFKLPGASKVSYYIVELEDYRTTSMEGVDLSLQHLKNILAKV